MKMAAACFVGIAVGVVIGLMIGGAGSYLEEEKPLPPISKDVPYMDLSKEAEAALKVEGLMLVAAVRHDGSIQLLKPEMVEHSKVTMPLETKAIRGVGSMSVVAYQGSKCLMWVYDVWVLGRFYDQYCAQRAR